METHEITVVPQPQAEFDDSHFVRADVCDIFLSHFLVNRFIMRNTSQIAADFLHQVKWKCVAQVSDLVYSLTVALGSGWAEASLELKLLISVQKI